MAEAQELASLVTEYQSLIRSLDPSGDERQMDVEERSLDSETEVVSALEKAQDVYMFEQMKQMLGRVAETGSLAECEEEEERQKAEGSSSAERGEGGDDEDDDDDESLDLMDADLGELIQTYIREEARHRAAHEALLRKKEEVEAMLASLEAIQQQILAASGGDDAMAGNGDGDDEGDGEEEEGAQELQEERAVLESINAQYDRLEKDKSDMVAEIHDLEATLDNLQTQVGPVPDGDGEMDDDAGAAMTTMTTTEEEVDKETEALEKQVEWTKNIVGLLEDIYGVTVDVTVITNDHANTNDDNDNDGHQHQQSGQGFMVTLTYPTQHLLRMKLSVSTTAAAGGVRLVSAELRRAAASTTSTPQQPPPATTTTTTTTMITDILEGAAGLQAPDDLVFVAREVGLRLRSQATVREQVKELQKRYIVKTSDAVDSVTVTFPEGVVATFQLLPGYPELPGSLRITSLVGVGGWKDGELAVTCKELNGLKRESLLVLVGNLYGKITTLNEEEEEEEGGSGGKQA